MPCVFRIGPMRRELVQRTQAHATIRRALELVHERRAYRRRRTPLGPTVSTMMGERAAVATMGASHAGNRFTKAAAASGDATIRRASDHRRLEILCRFDSTGEAGAIAARNARWSSRCGAPPLTRRSRAFS
jgi:hypothetical protein